MKLNCVILASGNSNRFGSNKLLTKYHDLPMIEHVFKVIPTTVFSRVFVVTKYPEITQLSNRYGFLPIENADSNLGQSQSIKLGILADTSCDGILFMVGDQPNIQQETFIRMIEKFKSEPSRIVSASYNGKRGNPCIFPSSLYQELLSLEGDVGGSYVIRQHESLLSLIECQPKELVDIDTPEGLTS